MFVVVLSVTWVKHAAHNETLTKAIWQQNLKIVVPLPVEPIPGLSILIQP